MNAVAIAGILWIVCGLAARWVAKHRRLPGADWYFFSGLLFGFVMLPIVIFSPASWLGVKKEPKEIPPSLDSEWPIPSTRIERWRKEHPR